METETWVLQGDAAARTGFSVSAIRKRRRMGFVAERKITTGADLPRVEVKLEDVLARAALQPQRRPSSGADESLTTPTGCVTIGLADLEELFERMVRAERRAERAEAEVQAMEVQARYTLGQMAELRRQLAAQDGPASGLVRPGGQRPAVLPPPIPPPGRAPALPATAPSRPAAPPPAPETGNVTRTRTRTGAGTATGASAVRADSGRVISIPSRLPEAARPVAAPAVERQGTTPDLELLARRLRAIYAGLDGYRSAPFISPEMEARRQRELAEYDRALVAACQALGVATGLTPGATVGVDARARLTAALARMGLDVRANGDGETRRARTRWPTVRPRS